MNKVFEKYKNKHKGERVFLIANGPSLAETDLSLLENENTIAMNRISLLYNHYMREKNLDKNYELIQEADKIKFVYLKEPNPIHENVMSFIQDFPRELGIEKYIDYDLQFEKSFLDPLKIILDVIQWNVEKTASLESFFS